MVMGNRVNRGCCFWEMLHGSSRIYSGGEDGALGGGRYKAHKAFSPLISSLPFSCGSPAPCPCDYPVPESYAALPSEGSRCEQSYEQHGCSLQGPLPSTEAPTVISFNIIGVRVTSVKNQNLLG